MDVDEILARLPENMTDEERDKYLEDIRADLQDEMLYEFEGEKLVPNTGPFMKKVKRALKDKYSQVIVVSSTGQNGKGKSHLLYQFGRDMTKEFGLKRNFFFGRTVEQLKNHTDALPVGDINLIDEALRLYYKRRAMSSGNIDLNEWMQADQRKTGVAVVMAIPDFTDLDKGAIKGKVDWWIEIMERGVAVVFKPDRFPTADPWHFAELQAIQKARKNITKENFVKKIKLLQKHPCYYGLLFWTAMPKEDEKAYLKIVSDALKEFGEGSPVDKEMADKLKTLQSFMKNDAETAIKIIEDLVKRSIMGKTYIQRQYGVDDSTLRRWKRWASEDFSKEEKVQQAVDGGDVAKGLNVEAPET